MNILVTGATGFIGSHLVARLHAAGDSVRALVRKEPDASHLHMLGIEVVIGDVRDPAAVARATVGREVVYHLAKAVSRAPSAVLRSVNIEGTANVARAAIRAGVGRLVHCSTAAVYGRVRTEPAVHEDMPLAPDSPYSHSKALAEQLVRAKDIRDALAVIVARITHVMGPRADSSLPLFQAIAGRRFRSIGGGENHHHPADVSDIVEGLLRCGTVAGAEGRTYNLAGNQPIRLREMIRLIAAELEVGGPLPARLPAAPFRAYKRLNDMAVRITGSGLPRADGIAFLISDRILDISRARAELGYAPSVSVVETIHRTAEWYRQDGSLPSRASNGI